LVAADEEGEEEEEALADDCLAEGVRSQARMRESPA